MPNFIPPNTDYPAGTSFTDAVQVDPSWVGTDIAITFSIRNSDDVAPHELSFICEFADSETGPWLDFGYGLHWRGGLPHPRRQDHNPRFGATVPAALSGKWVRARIVLTHPIQLGMFINQA